MIARAVFFFSLLTYLSLLFPFTGYLRQRPVAVKLGYMPEAEAIKIVAGDQRSLLAELAIVKVLFYYGTLVEHLQNKVKLPIEYMNMFKTLQTAVKLDPYNMDVYYFTQAAFTWEVGRAREVNDMLLYGMKYRKTDFYLPFFAGFNSAYFLKDYKSAAEFMKKAAELSGDPLFTNLAARYFYESGQNNLGIIFLESMERGTKDRQIRNVYEVRRKALLAVRKIQIAARRFEEAQGMPPEAIADLVAAGFLDAVPADPYGGEFYLSESGAVQTTSRFAFAGSK